MFQTRMMDIFLWTINEKDSMSISGKKILPVFLVLSSLVFTIQETNMIYAQNISLQSTPNETSSSIANWTGTIDIMPTLAQALRSLVHTSLTDAVKIAQDKVGTNSSVSLASLNSLRGFLVYYILITDSSGQTHRVLVDPGNGKILNEQILESQNVIPLQNGPPITPRSPYS